MAKKDINLLSHGAPPDIKAPLKRKISQSDINSLPDKSIPQRTLEGWIIFAGLAADRPNGSTTIKAWFSTDTNTLNLWNGSAWVQEIFT